MFRLFSTINYTILYLKLLPLSNFCEEKFISVYLLVLIPVPNQCSHYNRDPKLLIAVFYPHHDSKTHDRTISKESFFTQVSFSMEFTLGLSTLRYRFIRQHLGDLVQFSQSAYTNQLLILIWVLPAQLLSFCW